MEPEKEISEAIDKKIRRAKGDCVETRENILFKKSIQLVRPIDLDMCHILRRECDIEVVEFVVVCVSHFADPFLSLLFAM